MTWHQVGLLIVLGAAAVLILALLVVVNLLREREPSPEPSGFITTLLHLTTTTGAGLIFVLERDVTFVAPGGDSFTAKAGSRTNLASVPGLLTWLQPRYGRIAAPAVMHDELCRRAGLPRDRQDALGRWLLADGTLWISRRDADGLLRVMLRQVGFSWPRRWLVWAAVRVGGNLRGVNRPTAKETLQLAACALLAVPLLLPALPVALWQGAFYAAEWATEPRGRT